MVHRYFTIDPSKCGIVSQARSYWLGGQIKIWEAVSARLKSSSVLGGGWCRGATQAAISRCGARGPNPIGVHVKVRDNDVLVMRELKISLETLTYHTLIFSCSYVVLISF